MGKFDYIVSDSCDIAQTSLCFLYQIIDRKISDIYGKDSKGTEISIKLACYRELDRELMSYNRKA